MRYTYADYIRDKQAREAAKAKEIISSQEPKVEEEVEQNFISSETFVKINSEAAEVIYSGQLTTEEVAVEVEDSITATTSTLDEVVNHEDIVKEVEAPKPTQKKKKKHKK